LRKNFVALTISGSFFCETDNGPSVGKKPAGDGGFFVCSAAADVISVGP
jgi:hypothetical protein